MFDNTVSTMTTPALETELVGLAGHLAAAQCRFLLLLGEFDRRRAWAGPGMRSCAQWLGWRVGLGRRAARDQLRVARTLPGLPLLTEAFAAGRLSYAKVRAITRIATPATEQTLLDVALAGTAAHVERVVRATRRCGADPATAAARRYVSWDWAEDGSLLLRARLTPEEGALLVAAIEAGVNAARTRTGGSAEPPPAAEPLGDAADSWAGDQDEILTAATEHAPGPAVDRIGALRADALVALATDQHADPYQVVIHVDAEGTRAEIENGPAIPPGTAERLACGSPLAALLTDREGNPLYLGRTRRLVSRALLAALRARDRATCRFPSCTTRQRLHAHHILAWSRGGPTNLDNLVLLCPFHHRLIHEGGYRTALVGGHVQFLRPDGRTVPAVGPPLTGNVETLVELRTAAGLRPSNDTLTPTWSGERMDLDIILQRLLPEARLPGAA